ncbi:MAG: hypothetical protein JRI23_32980 [Deltaproteobacteria bacterium]|nr:hypothetical protein [Deltaproteobacteria bacterium]MBW2537068.1 hypothetical protein [Deltaproteobacteria bacterium]
MLLAFGFTGVGAVYQHADVARWVGFLIAAYAAVANDSIQTIGTFIASNKAQRWWRLWLFIGGIFLLTVGYSFFAYDGDVSYQRLATKGFATTPTSFSYLQVAAPLFLLALTRLRMPVSTTFLLLTSFTTSTASVGKVLVKSLAGYGIAFVAAVTVFLIVARLMERWTHHRAASFWRPAQWVTSGALWSVWLMQDAANIAVYLPRRLNGLEFAAFAGIIFLGLGLLFRMRGERIQHVVDEKSSVVDVRAATLIDLIYGTILFYFKVYSQVPMSTTWVFIGLLGGRELAMAFRGTASRSRAEAAGVMAKDASLVGIGLVVSLVLAALVNPVFRAGLLG